MILSNNNGTFTPVAGGNATFVGTKASFDAVKNTLPDNTVAYITDDGAGDEQYSTEETYTNKRWIDNKKIYRKVLTLNTSESGGHNIDVASLNISQLTTFRGIYNDTEYNYTFPVPDYGDEHTRLYLSYDASHKLIHYETGTQYGINGTLIVIVEYTKTTE